MFQALYSFLSVISWPILKLLGYLRAQQGKETPFRLSERYGRTKISKTNKDIIWIHAASNGEALSALPIINSLMTRPNAPHILMTTMTVTAADLIKKRVDPNNITHQFIPYDHPSWIRKFHDHWSPNMAIWIESELWPNHLKELKKRNIPSILLNARLSNRSVKRWRIAKTWFQNMMSCFDIILAQTDRDADNLKSLGLHHVGVKGNLKDLSPALPFDPYAANDIQGIIESRPTILFASTHYPEEEIIFNIHQKLKQDFPDLLSIIVPRHPKRGNDIANQLNKSNLTIAQRSLKMSPRVNTDIYIADTLGELGLFYHLCPITFIGNSLGTKPGGGHNLLEAAWHHCAIISGHDMHNFSIQAKEMPEHKACIVVDNSDELYEILKKLLNDSKYQQKLSDNAFDYVSQKYDAGLQNILNAIEPTCQKAGIS